MPLMKIMLLSVGWCTTMAAASIAVPFLTFFSFRLARVDFVLKPPEVKTYMCDTDGDNKITTKEMRQREHPLSSKDPFYTGSLDNTVKWIVKTGEEVKTLEGHTYSISCMVYVPQERALFTGSLDNTVKSGM